MEETITTMNKKSKSKKKKKKPSKISVFISNNKSSIGIISGLLFAILSIFTLISIISYIFTWAEDQSLLSNNNLIDTIITAENQGGKAGFVWANFLFSKLFGVGSLVIPFFFGAISIFCFRIKKIKFLRLLFLSLFGAIVISMLFTYIFSFTKLTAFCGQGIGGSYGHYINEWLIAMLGAVGTAGVILLLLTICLLLTNRNLADKIVTWFNSLFKAETEENNLEEEEEEIDEDKEEEEDEEEVVVEVNEEEIEEMEKEEEKVEEEEEVEDTYEVEILNKDIIEQVETIEYNEDEEHRYDPRLSLSTYKFPPTSLLNEYNDKWHEVSRPELDKNRAKIEKALNNFGIKITKISARIGPTVTLYEVVPAPGVKVAQIKRLEEDIALSLAARGVRVVTLVGSSAIGIEVANDKPSVVSMRSVIEDPKFKNTKYELPIVLGRSISSEVVTFDLAKMPHLLVAGATGQGKSVGLNAIITSLLYTKHPAELKFVMIDPKVVELSLYESIANHYLAKLPEEEEAILTDTQKVIYTLNSLCILMESRYQLLKAASVRTIKEYNEKFLSRKLNPLKGHDYMAYIVVVIDEFADLLMTAGSEIEQPITRLAQKARAIGIHLIIATQRPTTNIITGTIKANFPARIAFKVISSVDSKTILDQTGANRLIGRGDMLFIASADDMIRVQCAFIDTPEVEALAKYISQQTSFGSPYSLPEYVPEDKGKGGSIKESGDRDELFAEAARLVVREQSGSTSLIQRKMNLGYNRSGRIMDQLEEAGIVGPSEGSKARQVRITSMESLEAML